MASRYESREFPGGIQAREIWEGISIQVPGWPGWWKVKGVEVGSRSIGLTVRGPSGREAEVWTEGFRRFPAKMAEAEPAGPYAGGYCGAV